VGKSVASRYGAAILGDVSARAISDGCEHEPGQTRIFCVHRGVARDPV